MTQRGGPDAIVVGAGIVGAACAAALARDGLRVHGARRAHLPARGTTAAGMGHLVVMDDSPEQLALTALLDVSCGASRRSSFAPASELERCGTVWVAEDDAQLDAVRAKQRVYARRTASRPRCSTSATLRDAEPNLRRGLAGGLLVPGDGVHLSAGRDAARCWRARASSAPRCASGRRSTRSSPTACDCGGETLRADVVVNAAGAAARELTPGLPVVPRKGHLVITDRHPGFCRHQIVELGYLTSAHVMTSESVAFNVQPRSTGRC